MPRTNVEVIEKVHKAVARMARGLTSAEVATKLDMPERTARRHLTRLFAERKLNRTGEYVEVKTKDGASLRFYYRYTVRQIMKAPAKKKKS